MTDEEIIALWREHKAVMGFAHALLAAEREACAKVCERMAKRTDDIRSAALEMAAENIRAREQQ